MEGSSGLAGEDLTVPRLFEDFGWVQGLSAAERGPIRFERFRFNLSRTYSALVDLSGHPGVPLRSTPGYLRRLFQSRLREQIK